MNSIRTTNLPPSSPATGSRLGKVVRWQAEPVCWIELPEVRPTHSREPRRSPVRPV